MIMVSGISVSFYTSSIFYNGALPLSGHTLSSVGSLQVPVQSGGRHTLCAGRNDMDGKYKAEYRLSRGFLDIFLKEV